MYNKQLLAVARDAKRHRVLRPLFYLQCFLLNPKTNFIGFFKCYPDFCCENSSEKIRIKNISFSSEVKKDSRRNVDQMWLGLK